MTDTSNSALSKIPEVTIGFWIIKILATTLGEVGGNAVTMELGSTAWQVTGSKLRSSRASDGDPALHVQSSGGAAVEECRHVTVAVT